MYGAGGRELISELRRTQGVALYNDGGVRALLSECASLNKACVTLVGRHGEAVAQDDPEYTCPLNVYKTAIYRNRRALIAYHLERCSRLERYRWLCGGVPTPDLRNKLAASEHDYFAGYSALLNESVNELNAGLCGAGWVGPPPQLGVDPTQEMKPPTSSLVSVLALVDVGALHTPGGVITLRQGSVHTLFRSDSEAYIRRGWLEERG